MILSALMVVIPSVSLGYLAMDSSKRETSTQIEDIVQDQALLAEKSVHTMWLGIQNNLKTSMGLAKAILNQQGSLELDTSKMVEVTAVDQDSKVSSVVQIPTMMLGGQSVAASTTVVDQIQKNSGAVSTIFQFIPNGMLRISTNVIKEDGSRAIGTYIPASSPVYQAVIKGESYFGEAIVVNSNFYTSYEPLKDKDGKLIGALFVGLKQADQVKFVFDEISEIVIGKTGYIYVLDEKGNYVLSGKRQRDGENIWEAKDADGNYFIQEIINTSIKAGDGITSKIYYPWQNAGENTARLKIAGYTYNPETKWIVGAGAYQEEFLDGYFAIQKQIMITVGIAIVIGLLAAFWFSTIMVQQFAGLVVNMKKVAEGDLTISTKDDGLGTNEIGQMSRAFNQMVDNLKLLVSNITQNAQTISATAQQLASSTQQVNASTQQISSGVQEVAAGGENLAKQTQEVSNNAKELTQESAKGAKAAETASTKMQSLASAVNQSSTTVVALGDKSQEIVKIVDTINSIASQTNLLALNAAIEAARAGEAGRGFAVVADEVRKLAEESQRATKDIEALIMEIKSNTEQAVNSMEGGKKEVEEGGQVVADALGALESISQKVKTIEAAIDSVSSVAQQSASSSQQMSAGVQQTSSAMQQVASAAQQLASTSQELEAIISQFRIDNNGVRKTVAHKTVTTHTAPAVHTVVNEGSKSSLEKVLKKSQAHAAHETISAPATEDNGSNQA